MAEPFLAQITLFAGGFAPRGWAFCDGQILPISQNQALYSLLGTNYSGDGEVTFALQDLRGRVPIHKGFGPGLPSFSLGQKGGVEEHFLLPGLQLTAEPHSHPYPQPGGADESSLPDRTFTTTTQPLAGPANVTLENVQPFLGLHFIIAIQGTFPSRS